MRKRAHLMGAALLAVPLILGIAVLKVAADGNETLGTPSITIEEGTGCVMAGTGLGGEGNSSPGNISFNVPGGAAIVQVIAYWYGRGGPGDDEIEFDGTPVTGTLIGEPVTGDNGQDLPQLVSQVYRADITGLGLVSAGANSIGVDGADFTWNNDGAGLIVIFDDGGDKAFIDIRDGHDFAALNQANLDFPLETTVPQTFTFPASSEARVATVTLFIGDGEASRPDAVSITVGAGAPSVTNDVVIAADGNEWDTLELAFNVAALETSVTVEVISRDDGTSAIPDSICWLAAAFKTDIEILIEGCRVTGGGVDTNGGWDQTFASGHEGHASETDRYTFGGQAGAPTGAQPQPFGEWTHHQQRGPSGTWVFHAGTASAPPGTEIDLIVCSDDGSCFPARPAPTKQIDFEGVGTFRNLKKPGPLFGTTAKGETFHWFEVHIEDLGEPGKGGKVEPPAQDCPPEGSSGGLANCDCPDYYSITIYAPFDPGAGPPDKVNVIYEVRGYVDGGNLQIHPALG